ncbi:F390 synthetase-related protein [Thalassospira sp. TSL5-1]|uniref:F390 synthetase-related protein n=1 Tax=Thalassospira sp. TSL5-1 TaxID=1544451 RepID=UPI0009F9E24D|nr:F390 synthetase-related protein [Thalassospira sp. TSL5-1]
MSLKALLKTRYGKGFRTREAIEAHHQRSFARFRRAVMPRSPFYADYADTPLSDLPRMTKQTLMAHFTAINTCGIDREKAFEIALRSEQSRDFSPMIGDVSVGLSTGTSGQRGLFLATPKERKLWAAILAGRFWPNLARPQRVAFFMRADNALYRTLGNPLLRFEFFDLLDPFDTHLPRLQALAPTVLIAPASMLKVLAIAQNSGQIALSPKRVISVAETLSPEDRDIAKQAFNCQIDEVYQATEGVLAFTCQEGNLHLNEAWMRIERDIIDPQTGAFCPIIHDFTRESLLLLNYRLNDVLIPNPDPCPCGSACMRIARIEGREDDALWWDGPNGAKMVSAEAIRTTIACLPSPITDYRVIEKDKHLTIWLEDAAPESETELRHAFAALAARLDVNLPALTIRNGLPAEPDFKRRRIRVERQPRHCE